MLNNFTQVGKKGIEMAKEYNLCEFYDMYNGVYIIPSSKYNKDVEDNVKKFLNAMNSENNSDKYVLSFNPPCEDMEIYESYWCICEEDMYE